VIQTLSTPTRRIAFAVVISALLHGLVLWLPHIELPQHELNLPPLIAKLEALPKMSAKVSHPKPKLKTPPPPALQDIAQPALAASAPVTASEVTAASAVTATSEVVAATSAPAATSEAPRPLLPKHARLHFKIYQGDGDFKVGETTHTLDIEGNSYTLKASVKTTGLASMIKSYLLVQTSLGEATAQTLKPKTFTEEVTESDGKKANRAEFDWVNHKIHFSDGSEAALPPDSQDILSILYQFPPMQKQEETVSIHIGTGKKFEEYRFEVMFAEPLETAMGTLQTVHFRKLHAPDEEGLEIWFAQEYRFLPVKIRYLERSGKTAAVAIITDIRVSDE
jgi:hypothetical protein